MKNILIIMMLTMLWNAAIGQKKNVKGFIMYNKDTIHCTDVWAYRTGGNVGRLGYTLPDGEIKVLKGKKKCMEVKTYMEDGFIFDLIPLKASKPTGYQRHIWRKVNGSIRVYDYENVISYSSTSSATGAKTGSGQVSVVRYTLKLPNGVYYKISKKNIAKFIAPFMRKNKQFSQSWKEEISLDNIEKAVEMYNAS